MRPLVLFFRRNGSDRLLFIEAFGWLAVAKLLVHTIPFRRLAKRLGQPQQVTPATIEPATRAVASRVSWAVQTAAHYIPFGFVCLPQAIAAQAMLRRRGVPSTLYLGVAPDRRKNEAITAHAWLRAGDKIVTGKTEAARHRVLASFADFPSP